MDFSLFCCRLLSLSLLLCFSLWPAAISPLPPFSHSHAKVNGRVYLIMNRWVSAHFLWHPSPSQFTSWVLTPSCCNKSFTLHWLVPVTHFLPMTIHWWSSEILLQEFRYLTDLNGVHFQVLYIIILPVAFSFWVLCYLFGSLTPFQTKPRLFPNKTLLLLSKSFTNCQTSMFESERSVLPF